MSCEFALWTRDRVREVIRREFCVALSVVSVGRLLRTMGSFRAFTSTPPTRKRAGSTRRVHQGTAGPALHPGRTPNATPASPAGSRLA
jgi:Winged helix-turn helix